MDRHLIACAMVLATASATTASDIEPRPEGTVARVEATAGDHTAHGTAFLIHTLREANGETTLYFVTAAHLFAAAPDLEPSGALRARLFIEGTGVLDVAGDRILLPLGSEVGLDVAILRVPARDPRVVPVRVTIAPPGPGEVFVIVGHHSDGTPTVLTERVRFESTRFVAGDRTAPDVAEFAGAPAFGPGGVFGFVTECGSARVPMVTLLGPAAAFIARQVPGWAAPSSSAQEFQLVQRMVKGPLLQVGCDAISAGEVDVPVTLGPGEALVDAQAALTSPTALRLSDVTVLSHENRTVKLRFTMVGVPPPAFPAAYPPPCPQGQALVTIAVNVVVFPKE